MKTMMKRIFLTAAACLCVALVSMAEDTPRIGLNAGFQAPCTLNATVAYEHPMGYGNSLSLFGEAGDHWQTPACHMFWKKYYWDGGLRYSMRLRQYKNANFRIFGGGYCGAQVKRFFLGLEVGLEYNYTFANNWQFTITQKNNFNFLGGADHFRNGLLVGIKLPL